MALPSSGPLSLANIQTEFGGSNPISLSEYYAGGGRVPAGTSGTYGAVPSSGTISIRNFYGTSNYVPISATGGIITTSGGYRYHQFLGDGTFSVSTIGTTNGVVQYTIISGGGGGANGNGGGGGGGAGGMLNGQITVSATNYTVTIGGGGAGGVPNGIQGTPGSNSSVFSTSTTGGAGGTSAGQPARPQGGSGGGGSWAGGDGPSAGISGQGNS